MGTLVRTMLKASSNQGASLGPGTAVESSGEMRLNITGRSGTAQQIGAYLTPTYEHLMNAPWLQGI